ncbi:hypothetical protein U8607_04110 [Methylobacterium durans]|uniref:hypothetical protein n=1 Tax=Methylobacterium durans TaxID=2202825 RepID=UPI002AFF6859|nr:hypothetical protein [Methylobacterium durans]MEA1831261.1 hypothetical protein [Methylobacterium durans]
MSRIAPDRSNAAVTLNSSQDDLSEQAGTRLPPAAQHSLDQIAAALNVTSALLSQNPTAVKDESGRVSLQETNELLQAFIRIDGVEARRRCLEFVKKIAFAQQPNRI